MWPRHLASLGDRHLAALTDALRPPPPALCLCRPFPAPQPACARHVRQPYTPRTHPTTTKATQGGPPTSAARKARLAALNVRGPPRPARNFLKSSGSGQNKRVWWGRGGGRPGIAGGGGPAASWAGQVGLGSGRPSMGRPLTSAVPPASHFGFYWQSKASEPRSERLEPSESLVSSPLCHAENDFTNLPGT